MRIDSDLCFDSIIEINPRTTERLAGEVVDHFVFTVFKVKIGFENLVSPELLQTVFANPDEFREKIKKEFERVMPQCLQNMGFGRKKITGNHIEKTCDNLHIEIDGIRMRIADAKNPTVVNEQAENSRPNNPLIRQRRQEAPKSSEMDEKLTAAVAAYKKRNNEE